MCQLPAEEDLAGKKRYNQNHGGSEAVFASSAMSPPRPYRHNSEDHGGQGEDKKVGRDPGPNDLEELAEVGILGEEEAVRRQVSSTAREIGHRRGDDESDDQDNQNGQHPSGKPPP